MPGTLYVCATPIGNLDDASLRLLATLREVTLICAEDTRHTQRLLARHDIHTRLTSCHQHSSPAKIQSLVEQMRAGDSLALVTDAGTPGISDPGPRLVQCAAAAGIAVVPIPGACALAAALSISGFDAQRFSFEGFLPRKPGRHRKALEAALAHGLTFVIYESPHRIVATLRVLSELEPTRPVVVCRELTKLFEETVRGTAVEAWGGLGSRKEVLGEFVLVVGSATGAEANESAEAGT